MSAMRGGTVVGVVHVSLSKENGVLRRTYKCKPTVTALLLPSLDFRANRATARVHTHARPGQAAPHARPLNVSAIFGRLHPVRLLPLWYLAGPAYRIGLGVFPTARHPASGHRYCLRRSGVKLAACKPFRRIDFYFWRLALDVWRRNRSILLLHRSKASPQFPAE